MSLNKNSGFETAGGLIDHNQLGQLVDALGHELLNTMIDELESGLERSLSELASGAIGSGFCERPDQALHALRGRVGLFGCSALAEAIRVVERSLVSAEQPDGAALEAFAARIADLMPLARQTIDALRCLSGAGGAQGLRVARESP